MMIQNNTISICMATYNGQRYIYEQLSSILSQIGLNDEIVIVDDCSSDNTLDIVKAFDDHRIKIYINEENKGVNYSFSKAISLSKGALIFLSDQDDIWIDGHYKKLSDCLNQENIKFVTSNFILVDKFGTYHGEMKYKLSEADSEKFFKNILKIFMGKIDYFGCCMALHRSLVQFFLPIPNFIESHDLWFAMVANTLKLNFHVEEALLNRRIHGSNLSVVKRPLIKKFLSRFYMFIGIFIIKFRICRYKATL